MESTALARTSAGFVTDVAEPRFPTPQSLACRYVKHGFVQIDLQLLPLWATKWVGAKMCG